MTKKSNSPSRSPGGRAEARRASPQEILRLLSEEPARLYEALSVTPSDANLSLPPDGRGLRIRASVRRGQVLPAQITVPLDGERVEVPVEVTHDFQEFRPR